MGRHDAPGFNTQGDDQLRAPGRRLAARWLLIVLVVAAGSALVVKAAANRTAAAPAAAAGCETALRVVASSSFAPVVQQVAPLLADGPQCVRVDVGVLDGRAAAERIGQVDADVWIADDQSWAGVANQAAVAPSGVAGSGTVLATSPVYMVTDRATAGRITRAGGSWLALERLLASESGVRLAVSDPAGSADGLVPVGAVGESVWLKQGMDASALAMSTIFTRTRTVPAGRPVLPATAGEVALVPEHALLSSSWQPGRDNAVLAATDHTALLRYTWLPTEAAVIDVDRRAALSRLLGVLSGPRGISALAEAGLRTPAGRASLGSTGVGGVRGAPGGTADRLPAKGAPPFATLSVHKVFHVFAVWYPADRRTKLLIGVDVSGSMAEPAAGSTTPLISFVRQGCLEVGELLPPDASLTLWEFGSQLDPPRDYRTLLRTAQISAVRGAKLRGAVAGLVPLATGTGLYDTVLAAFQQATATYRSGEPNRVMIFTDGRNQDDPGSLNVAQLSARLSATADPDRPVALVVVAFGEGPGSDMDRAIKPVGGIVDRVASAYDVLSVFVHLAAGGLHAQ